ncbi:unnamed protein product [Trifolium pratense]|uniref:Uncharacterized protein n=1 Tax=Trifolium pratense TaxID=57577 RepID=A0ACB0L4D0_TRIPR|nr:unnamed protein product [Trifolium pratense]
MARLVMFLQSKNGNMISSSAGSCDLILSNFVKTFSLGLLFIFLYFALLVLYAGLSVITYRGREVPMLVAFTICFNVHVYSAYDYVHVGDI